MIPVMILCGGKGTRLREVTELLPKPMVPVGGIPLIWHIMNTYASFGFRRFILCLGYKKEEFVDYFLNFQARNADITLNLSQPGKIVCHGTSSVPDWEVTLADTGEESLTATRVRIASKYLKSSDHRFFLTYGDAVADLDIAGVLDFHRDTGKKMTISAVRPEARFGEIDFDGDAVKSFSEKPINSNGYINGGFMVLEKSVVSDYISAMNDEFFEQRPMRDIVRAGEMAAFRHDGFWQCMDTPREHALLNELWRKPPAPWVKHWKN